MAFLTAAYDETKPAGSRAPTLGDDDIREFKSQIRERLSIDHDTRANESGAEESNTPTGTIGYHKKVTLTERSGDPTNVANAGILYTKDDGGDTELYWEDDGGTVKQLTKDGTLNITATEAVLLSGDQTIAGVKTLSSFAITPSSAPTTNYQVSNKKYVDDNKFVLSDITGILGAWDATKSTGNIYQAATDGFVVVYTNDNNGMSGSMIGYSDSAASPTTIRAVVVDSPSAAYSYKFSMMFPVKKNDYWKVVMSIWTANILWIPLGS